MAWRFVLQPDRKLALFSDIVDDFTIMHLDAIQAYRYCIEDEQMPPTAAFRKVARGLFDDTSESIDKVPDAPFKRWQQCLIQIEFVHGMRRRQEVEMRVLGKPTCSRHPAPPGELGDHTDLWRDLSWALGDEHATRICKAIDWYCLFFVKGRKIWR